MVRCPETTEEISPEMEEEDNVNGLLTEAVTEMEETHDKTLLDLSWNYSNV
jgi:hypothetical protein